MPYQGYEDGLYLVKQKSIDKGVDHYGILDIGNRIHHPNVDGINPVLIHQTPPHIKLDWLQDTGAWDVQGKITDEKMAIERIKHALKDPAYNLLGNNCEHFSRFVATGKRESTQVQAVVAMAGLAVIAIAALR